MIRVACEACGAHFKAREEFAGRRGKCPGCGEPVLVPELPATTDADDAPSGAESRPAPKAPPRAAAPAHPAVTPSRAPAARPARVAAPPPEPPDDEPEDDAGDEPEDEPVAAPVSSRRRASSGRGKTIKLPGRRSAPPSKSLAAGARLTGVRNRRSPLATFLIIFAIVGVVIWGGLAAFGGGGIETNPHYSAGIKAHADGRYAEALVQLRQVPPDNGNHGRALELIAKIEEEQGADIALADAKAADQLFSHVSYFETRTLAGYDESEAFYPSYVRYMLKRGQEFLDRFPDHARAADITALMQRHAQVASLDTPATEADLEVELKYRLPSFAFRECWQSIAEFEAAGPGREEAARALRADVLQAARERWEWTLSRLQEESLQPGQEDWRRVAGRALGFLDLVEGIPGAGTDARAWYDRAVQNLGG